MQLLFGRNNSQKILINSLNRFHKYIQHFHLKSSTACIWTSEKLKLILAFHSGTLNEKKMSKETRIKQPMGGGGRNLQISIYKAKCKIAVATFKSIFQMYKMCCLVRELQRSSPCSHSMDCDKSQETGQYSECFENHFLCSNSKKWKYLGKMTVLL